MGDWKILLSSYYMYYDFQDSDWDVTILLTVIRFTVQYYYVQYFFQLCSGHVEFTEFHTWADLKYKSYFYVNYVHLGGISYL